MTRRPVCAVHPHQDQPLLTQQHVWPPAAGGPDTAGNTVLVCAAGAEQLLDLFTRVQAAGGYTALPFADRRRYPYGVRRLVLQAWNALVASRR